jgi:hypothetical protein
MVYRFKKSHPALKHGGYAATTLLPGERAADFEKLHQDVIAELTPDGVIEDGIVATIARLVWRKDNLQTLRIAEIARRRYGQLMETVPNPYGFELTEFEKVDPVQCEAARRSAVDQARKELGSACKLAEIGEIATVERLMAELAVQERLDVMIDKCLKQLLHVRGIKLMAAASSSEPRKCLARPQELRRSEMDFPLP